MKKYLKHISLFLLIFISINLVSSQLFVRQDFTQNKRYSLSQYSIELTESIEKNVLVEVFLTGDLPSNYKRLEREIGYLLEEYAAYNSLVKFNFINPLNETDDAMEVANQFYENGMSPKILNQLKNGEMREKIIFPWAIITYNEQKLPVKLISENNQANQEELINSSIEELEYQLTNALKIISQPKAKKLAIIKGQNELDDIYIADLLQSLKQYYYIAAFTLDSVEVSPVKTLNQLSEYDLIIDAKPQETFSEKKKYLLDQYVMQGGKAVWLTEHVKAETDSLMKTGKSIALPLDLNLHDLFFSYGIRINPKLVKDIFCAPINLAVGQGQNTEINQFPWYYFPLSQRNKQHPINQNLSPVKFEFTNPIDTLKNGLKKHILLQSSPLSAAVGTPSSISIEEIKSKPNKNLFNDGRQNLAVLLEGNFKSAYKNRIKPFEYPNSKDNSISTHQAFISDGDFIKNKVSRGKPMPLGFDRFSGKNYGNKQFFINLINYMLADEQLVKLRNKSIKTANLDSDKLAVSKLSWQLLNLIGLPALIIAFGFVSYYIKRRQFVK
ncbi:gliding motility-associated ABC transporter substrate-binding protein GldG [Psychroflexus sp. ALD_RP9]|uniref:gliding motility-associated ABC transporter substrate-binding protein GldG n=1 Tax=Psychroflexus sp. ALD_RP9 TaxID=2777186 RepID=UPI001A900BD2|nr:gliding motility-associated ABC transporter substrate-binding protein GldG [Psychroflexus sp. ALD_RP9]QSS96545.1 gliding motility-associated ABC transporter substrate-binding protein GldG [Psychroflexus sp. ALD_RP9]